ncbi:hypothetical protein LA5095_03915 [Roseibium album]|uniref:Uncharacterized protein n=1 Tax=Roseibium album TaxID=311410 RepID=A0A0M6ZBC6_9HYPH|nr:hypothetical protein LA5094_02856 [Roseibium album]CTQ77311.1 hypothetical protein LA5095_03915 [Roseibium album]CTQ77557.1 hypothetical protein LA5096_05197 [Roseibium album]
MKNPVGKPAGFFVSPLQNGFQTTLTDNAGSPLTVASIVSPPAASSKYSDRQEIISGIFQIIFLPNCAIHLELDWPVVRTPRLRSSV